jgi:hypothetical protein
MRKKGENAFNPQSKICRAGFETSKKKVNFESQIFKVTIFHFNL